MNILIDIGHPAHVHYFRNMYYELRERHGVTVTCKSVPMIEELLTHYKIPYVTLGKKGATLSEKYLKQISFTTKLLKIMRDKHIDIALGNTPAVVHCSKILQSNSLYVCDDDQCLLGRISPITAPYANVLMSPDVLKYERMHNAVYYPGYHELAYLHPNRFIPDTSIPEKYGLRDDEDYFILRFNAFKAHHDHNHGGMTLNQKRRLISILRDSGRVFITTEAQIDPEFERYRLPVKPYEMHDFMAQSKVFVSDSQTMSSEAAVLGVPSFRCNTFAGKVSYLEEQEKRFGLTFGFQPHQFGWMLDKITESISNPNLKNEWGGKREKMLSRKIDVTSFWVWFIDNYPDSKRQMHIKDFSFEQFT